MNRHTETFREKLAAYLWLQTAMLIIAIATIYSIPKAHADPINQIATNICIGLNKNPTTNQVVHDLTILVANGLTPYEAGQLIATSVINNCPQYEPILRAFVNQYGKQQLA